MFDNEILPLSATKISNHDALDEKLTTLRERSADGEKDFKAYHGQLITSLITDLWQVAATGESLPKPLLAVYNKHINQLFNTESLFMEQCHSGDLRTRSESADQVLSALNSNLTQEVTKQIARLAITALESSPR